MHPLITTLQLGSAAIPIASYGAMLVIALWVGGLGTLRAASRRGMEPGAVISALGLAIGGGFFGALATHALAQLARAGSLAALRDAPESLLGLSVAGALALGAATLIAFAPGLGLSAARVLDAAVPSVALAQAIGRVGCWLGGCCFGAPAQGFYAMHLHGESRHPWPLYEALALLALAYGFARADRASQRAQPGVRAASYLAIYAVLRVALEPLRGDAVRGVFLDGAVSTAQLMSIGLLAAALGFLARARVRSRSAASGSAAVLAGVALALGVHAATASAERVEVVTRSRGPIARFDAGTFVMGSDEAGVAFAIALCQRSPSSDATCDAATFAEERPAHLVQLPAFAIDRTEVTNAAYRRCVANGRCAPPRVPEGDARSGRPEQPVVMITAAEAEQYCAFAGGRLPTEAEWERAARAGSPRRFPWGNAWNSRLANARSDAPAQTDAPPTGEAAGAASDVASFPDGASPHGLFDMAGNVWELTSDGYERDAYQRAQAIDGYALPLRVAPRSAANKGARVVRGGSFAAPPYQLRTAQRASVPEAEPRSDVGFRCAYSPSRT